MFQHDNLQNMQHLISYYRYNERTGQKERITFTELDFRFSLLKVKDSTIYTRSGKPRKSVVVKGKRFYKE